MMSLGGQARYADSNLCKFLDIHLPHRGLIVEAWRERLRAAPWNDIALETDRARLGVALELRIGLDLGNKPSYPNLLGFLPPDDYRRLVEAGGFSRAIHEHLPESNTTDPILQTWARTSHPIHCASDDQQAALAVCLDAAAMDQLAHSIEHLDLTVQDRRAWFLKYAQRSSCQSGAPDPALLGLSHLWAGYLTHGRKPLTALGTRVLVSPELAPGFAVADLVVGRTVVEIKASVHAERDLALWLNQVLAYLLMDRCNVLHLDQIALYLGWQALLLVMSADEVLRVSTAGPTPTLGSVREAFTDALGADIADGAHWQLTQRYPMPPEPISPTST